MKDQFVPYELALKLKELGFDEECLAYYNGNEEFIYGLSIKDIAFTKKYHKDADCASVLVPLWQQAFDWLMDKGYWVDRGISNDGTFHICVYQYKSEIIDRITLLYNSKGFDTKQEANLKALTWMLKNID